MEEIDFSGFGFSAEIMQGIAEAGFTEPTPIQAKAIPEIQAGHDVIGQALTGTGKTAAFGLPILDKLEGGHGIQFLILVPTRELAAQVSAELYRFAHFKNLHTAAFTGGQSYSRQEKLLKGGLDVLVATPGRLIDLMDSGHFVDENPSHIVVDEADEMLDMGFIEDIRKIFDGFPGPHQTMLFSATMPRPVVELAEHILKDPVELSIDVKETANNNIQQLFFVIEEHERTDAVIRLIDAQNVEKAMIFCRTKEETDALNILLGGRGYNVNCLHGDMEQAQRTRVMNAFRRGEIDILVATDVAARGLDVDDVTHVFNFHLPFDSRGYVHRIGRTGRAGKSGTAITLVTPRELRQLEAIKRNVGAQMENRLIPTRTEVTSIRLKNLFRELLDQELDMDLFQQVQTLAVNQDVLVLLTKLMSRTMDNGADKGPEHIGIEGQRLDQLLAGKSGRPRERRERGGGGRRTRREAAPPQEPIDVWEEKIAAPKPQEEPAVLDTPHAKSPEEKRRIPRPPKFDDTFEPVAPRKSSRKSDFSEKPKKPFEKKSHKGASFKKGADKFHGVPEKKSHGPKEHFNRRGKERGGKSWYQG